VNIIERSQGDRCKIKNLFDLRHDSKMYLQHAYNQFIMNDSTNKAVLNDSEIEVII
jgi:hypothetical protein